MSLKEKLEAAAHPHAKPPVHPQAPMHAPSSPRGMQLTITIPSVTVHATREFYGKLPFLVLLLLVFSFSMVLFEKANFHSNDLVDFNRMQYNIPKFWSVSFILFILLFALALALAVFYGFGQTWLLASIALPVTVIPAVVISFFFPNALLLPFLVFALTVSASAIVASMRSQAKFSSIWSTLGVALMLFIFLTFLVSFAKIASSKDIYVNQFIDSGIVASTSFQGIGSATSGGTQAFDFASLLDPDAIKQAVTRDKIAKVISADRVKSALADGVPGWNSIVNRSAYEDKVRQKLIDDVYSNVGTDFPALFSNLQTQQTGGTGVTSAPAPTTAPTIKDMLGRMPWFVAFYNNFSLLMSILVTSVAAFFLFISRIFATLFAWMLNKLY